MSEAQTLLDRPCLVSWLGGEPFQWPALWEMTDLFRRDYRLRIGVTTSGQPLFSKQVRDRTIAELDEVTVSVDGVQSDHEWLRNQPGGHRKLCDALHSLCAARSTSQPLVRVNMVLTHGNIRHFPDACREIAALGVDELTFNQLGGNDRPEFYPENRLRLEDVEYLGSVLPALRADCKDRGLRIRGGDAYLQRIGATTAGQPIPIDDCHPGEEFLFVDELGRASPCSFTSNSFAISIKELDTAEAIVSLPQRFRTARGTELQSPCTDCHATHVFAKFDGLSTNTPKDRTRKDTACV